MLVDLLTAAVLLFVGYRLVTLTRAAAGPLRGHVLDRYRRLRLRHFAWTPVVFGAVIAAAWVLLWVPALRFGWWTALGGTGNPVTGATERTVGSPLEYAIPLLFLAMLVPAMPVLVEREERAFRLGAEDWSVATRVRKAIEFGAVHALIGIPIGVALALSLAGGYLTVVYLRGYRAGGRGRALSESVSAHLGYNSTIVAIAIVLFAATAVADI